MGKISRSDRLNGEFQKEIHEVIARKLNHPDVKCMVSVMRVEATKDLKYAKVFLSIFAKTEEETIKAFNAISSEAKRIRYELAHSMRIRTVPELSFVLDKTIEYGNKMNKILNDISKGENLD